MLLQFTNTEGRRQAVPASRIIIIGKATLQEMTEMGAGCFVHTDEGLLCLKDKFEDVCAAYDRATVRN